MFKRTAGRRFASLSLVILLLIVLSTMAACAPENGNAAPENEPPPQENEQGADGENIADTQAEVMEALNSLTFKKADGTDASFGEYSGQLLFINVWATWCTYCVRELPSLQAASDTYFEGKKAKLLLINTGEDQKTIDKFFEDNPDITLESWSDKEQVLSAMTQKATGGGIPYSIVISPENEYLGIIAGAMDEDKIGELFASLSEEYAELIEE